MFINVDTETIEWACNHNAALTATTGRNTWHSNKVAYFVFATFCHILLSGRQFSRVLCINKILLQQTFQ